MKGNKATLGIKSTYLQDKHLYFLQDTFIALGDKAGVSLDDVSPLKDQNTIGEAIAYVNELGKAAKENDAEYSIFVIDENNVLTQEFTNDIEDAESCDINETI